MGLPRRLLGEGERVVVQLRTHGKALIAPVLALLVLAAVTGLAVALMPESLVPVGWMALAVLVGAGVLAWVLLPFLRWRTTTYTLTTRRLITRRGILSRRGHDVPLARVVDVSFERSLGDRVLGCGTLYVRTASEAEPVVLPDVPDVAQVQQMVSELVFGSPAELPVGHR